MRLRSCLVPLGPQGDHVVSLLRVHGQHSHKAEPAGITHDGMVHNLPWPWVPPHRASTRYQCLIIDG